MKKLSVLAEERPPGFGGHQPYLMAAEIFNSQDITRIDFS
jgi:hypothetical protein